MHATKRFKLEKKSQCHHNPIPIVKKKLLLLNGPTMVTNIQYHASPQGKSTTEERPLPGRTRYKRCPCSSVGALSHPCCCVLPIFSEQMCPINNTSPYGPLQREREPLVLRWRSSTHSRLSKHTLWEASHRAASLCKDDKPRPSRHHHHLLLFSVINAHSSWITRFYMMRQSMFDSGDIREMEILMWARTQSCSLFKYYLVNVHYHSNVWGMLYY